MVGRWDDRRESSKGAAVEEGTWAADCRARVAVVVVTCVVGHCRLSQGLGVMAKAGVWCMVCIEWAGQLRPSSGKCCWQAIRMRCMEVSCSLFCEGPGFSYGRMLGMMSMAGCRQAAEICGMAGTQVKAAMLLLWHS